MTPKQGRPEEPLTDRDAAGDPREEPGAAGVTQAMILAELRKIGFADAEDCASAKLKYSNKLKALELMGKHRGMFDRRAAAETEDLEDARRAVFGDGEDA